MSGTRKTEMVVSKVPRFVRPMSIQPTGIGTHRTDDLKDQNYEVMAMYLYEYDDHSREPVFLLIRPEDGQIITRFVGMFKAVKEVLNAG